MSISQNSKIDNIKIVKKKRKKYKPRNPLYYYYSIDTKTYKYTCKNKNRKQILDFRCSDSICPAQGIFYRKDDYFKPNIFTKHIPYEEHSYIISKEFSEKYQNNMITENDFNSDKKKFFIRQYFKILFNDDPNLMPIQAKDIFKNKYPHIDLSSKEIEHTIRSQYRIIKQLYSEKITNTECLFKFIDNNNNNISKVIDYNLENNPNKIYKLVLIANEDMYNNLKDNQINQFFLTALISWFLQINIIFD